MILSHSRKFIFIKTRKVSGTSMEISLSQVCGNDDILTPISYEDELIRLDLGGCLPQNYGDKNEQRFRELIRARNPDVDRVKHKGRFYNHVPAIKVRDLVGQIRHIVKGRYKKDSAFSRMRASIRKAQDP